MDKDGVDMLYDYLSELGGFKNQYIATIMQVANFFIFKHRPYYINLLQEKNCTMQRFTEDLSKTY
jgi:hypothetical protein